METDSSNSGTAERRSLTSFLTLFLLSSGRLRMSAMEKDEQALHKALFLGEAQ